jgi:hypothetical protein
MKIGAGFLAALTLAACITVAQVDVLLFGEGGTSCGAWTEKRQARSFQAGLSAQWIAGYLTGLNEEAQSPARDALSGTDFDALMG